MTESSPEVTEYDIENFSNEDNLGERWNKMVLEVQKQYGWSPRKARRYLESVSRRNFKKVLKKK